MDITLGVSSLLSDENFARIVRYAPLISIDLILTDPKGAVCLGLRQNEPARGWYFVPGGVVRKNETLDCAFRRILEAEAGLTAERTQARFLGIYEHFYPTNRFLDPAYSTHYVVAAYELCFPTRPTLQLDEQHSHVRWMSQQEILNSPEVQDNTKAYFRG